MTTDLDIFTKALVTLDKSHVKRLLHHLQFAGETLDNLTKLQISLADWLTHLGMFSDGQINRTLEFVSKPLEEFSQLLPSKKLPSFTVVVCDGRWVSCANKEKFLDIQDFEEVDQLPEHAVTHILCDVAQLYYRMEFRTVCLTSKETPNAG